MSWAAELREAFGRLRAGEEARVGFAERDGTLGALGREFNRLAETLAPLGPGSLTREQAHALRNRLAGILAALHLLRESEPLTAAEQAALAEILADAQQLDARLRAR